VALAERLICVALCQGAALHLIDGTNGVKDFDVWTFFAARAGEPPFPWRRRRTCVFGDPRFGRPPDKPDFLGRHVDLLGRSLEPAGETTPDAVLSGYLSRGATETARALSEKAVVFLEPADRLGARAWPPAGVGADE
jgi:hypothetical protein